MILRPTKTTRTETLFPDTTLFRSLRRCAAHVRCAAQPWLGAGAGTAAPRATGAGRNLCRPWPHLWQRVRDPAFRQWLRAACRTAERGGVEESRQQRSEEHTSELQSLMRTSYAVFCLKKKKIKRVNHTIHTNIYRTNNIQRI